MWSKQFRPHENHLPRNFEQKNHNSYRQDAREGGVIPPLPRNCKRLLFQKIRSKRVGVAVC